MAVDIEFNVRNGMTVGSNKHLVLDVNGALSGSDITCTSGQILSGGVDLLDVFDTSLSSDASVAIDVFKRTDPSNIAVLTISVAGDYLQTVDASVTKFDVVDTAEASSITGVSITTDNQLFVHGDTLYYVTDNDAESGTCTVDAISNIAVYTDYNETSPTVLNLTDKGLTITYDDNQHNALTSTDHVPAPINFSEPVNSADWTSTYTTVAANSASWASSGGGGGGTYSETIGDGTSTEISITHNLDTENIVYSVADATTKEFVFVQGEATTGDILTLTFDQAPTQDEYNVTVIGGAGSGTNTIQTVTTTTHTQVADTTHHLYDDDTAGDDIVVTLVSPATIVKSVTHKKIGSNHNVILTPPTGVTIDGYSIYNITQQNESVTLFTDGINYYIQ